MATLPSCKPQLLSIFFLISTTHFAAGEIKNTHIRHDSRPMILFQKFGFTSDGHVSVSVNHLSWKSKYQNARLKPSSLGFFLVRDKSFSRILNESEYTQGFCMLSSHYVKIVLRLSNLGAPIDRIFDGSVIVDEPDEYNLVFGNCQPEFEVSMKVRTEMYNVDNNGRKDFLPAGQHPLPKLFFLFFVVYTTFFAIWVFVCVKQRSIIDKIHLIMCALLIFKSMKMLCAFEDYMYIKNTGTPHGWDVAFYFFGFFKGVTLFTVIVLIGTGWSFLKPYLQEREKSVLMFVIPLQVLENIAAVVIGETGPATKGWFTWNEMLLIMDVVCCCTVFFPIVWSIRTLREASTTDGKAARNLRKLTLFKKFYMVVIAYLYFTRVVVSVMGSIVNYRYEWVTTLASEGGSLVFYLFIFHNFQPVEKNPYLLVQDGEEGCQMAEEGSLLEK
ncbi:protein GPR107-like [Cynara cardunculus var. scolymus]|uniref:Transmembrane receptor, eukaryota n=1 Tax=Cynara cardunculus var. scolymus TaxID=59895 RepID=A0A103YDW1_CYNCS|nr:protein GPR107-like [Cynara cardunculus var. scolymus]KVI07281.1 Transmembrane receptor, eukaryota [Cynara cardunculus var. scolymus]